MRVAVEGHHGEGPGTTAVLCLVPEPSELTDAWWDDVAAQVIGAARRQDPDAIFTLTILDADNPALVGERREFRQ